MNKIIRSTVDGGSESIVRNPDAPSSSGEREISHQTETETVDNSAVEPTDPVVRGELPLDETFELLRNQRRRYVLEYLETAGGEVSLSDLAERIAAWENNKEVRQITSSERKRVYVGLYQCHLPKMDGMGVVSFNKSRGLIKRGEQFATVLPYVERAAAPDRPARVGPAVGLSIIGATVLPMAFLQLSQSMLTLSISALIVIGATMWGVTVLRRTQPDQGTKGVDPGVV